MVRGRGVDQVLPIRAIPEVAQYSPGSMLFTFVLQSTFHAIKIKKLHEANCDLSYRAI